MDGRQRVERVVVGVDRSVALRVVGGVIVGVMLLTVALPAVPDVRLWLLGLRGRVSMTLLGITMSAWAGYQTDGLVPGVAPAVGLALGLLLGGAWVLVRLGLLWSLTVGGFGVFLGASLRRYRSVAAPAVE